MVKHLKIRVQGKVQGVFFRAATLDKAVELDLKGYVRNEADGSVFIEAEGNSQSLENLVRWCHHGPPKAAVTTVSVDEGEWNDYRIFEIKR